MTYDYDDDDDDDESEYVVLCVIHRIEEEIQNVPVPMTVYLLTINIQ